MISAKSKTKMVSLIGRRLVKKEIRPTPPKFSKSFFKLRSSSLKQELSVKSGINLYYFSNLWTSQHMLVLSIFREIFTSHQPWWFLFSPFLVVIKNKLFFQVGVHFFIVSRLVWGAQTLTLYARLVRCIYIILLCFLLLCNVWHTFEDDEDEAL